MMARPIMTATGIRTRLRRDRFADRRGAPHRTLGGEQMILPRRQFLKLVAGAAATPAGLCSARAESYPARPVTVVTSGPAGGPTDAIGRIIAQRMGETLGQTLVMGNAPSSGGIAVRRVGRAAPDGYTIALGHWGTHVIDGAVLTLPYDLVKDFEPIAQVATNASLILSRNGVPAGNLQELIAWMKMNPGKATLASPGPGSPPHIAGV